MIKNDIDIKNSIIENTQFLKKNNFKFSLYIFFSIITFGFFHLIHKWLGINHKYYYERII